MKQMSIFKAVIKFSDRHPFHGYGIETDAAKAEEMTRENCVFRSFKCFPNEGHPLMALGKRRINDTYASFDDMIKAAQVIWEQQK